MLSSKSELCALPTAWPRSGAQPFGLDPEQTAFRDGIVEFARAALNQGVAERDARSEFDRGGWQKCADAGLLGLAVPEEFGGAGLDPLGILVAMEALGYGCEDNGMVFALGNHIFSCVTPIVRFGSEAQKRRFLPGLASGNLIGAHAMTEEHGGSDAASARTTARREDSEYALYGRKTFITNGPIADIFIVFARTGEQLGARSVSAFVVESAAPGFRAGRPMTKMGLRGAPMSEIEFDGCRVPEANLLGGEGNGMMVFHAAAEAERCYLSAANVGAMKRQLEKCVRRLQKRGLTRHQALTHRLAEIKVNIEAAELMLRKIAWLWSHGRPAFFESAAAKLFTSESYVKASLAALQLHGAYGYMEESGIERQMRDSLASTMYAGASEIQKEIVASWLGLGRAV
ncbi:MAG TPA: acyl-CoA dehydrogenase family protein [Blastocatellia bacterium]|jgi:Acyl-CoA dehydrogenases